MAAYYNENDSYVAQWLRNLIAGGHIAPGDVDERDIQDVRGDDVQGYTQCHFFAGIGGWSLALRLADWEDERPVWTGSCPCQPFSDAGKRGAHNDERHLWPEFLRLITDCRPSAILGEQVASKLGRIWLDRVRADLEALGHDVGAADLCSASINSPNVRQRLWWMASAESQRRERCEASAQSSRQSRAQDHGASGGMELPDVPRPLPGEQSAEAPRYRTPPQPAGGGLRTFWSNFDLVTCFDGKARRIEPFYEQMVDGIPESLGRVRPETTHKIEEEVLAHAETSKEDPRETMFSLWMSLSEETLEGWPLGRPDGVHEAPVLLSLLRQLSEQGWAFSECLSRASKETEEILLRSMWWQKPITRSSRRRRLDEQFPSQHPDTVRVLSSILACHAQAAWGEAFDANARNVFPLIPPTPTRVGKLRAYGNAINPYLAAEVIEVFKEYRP